MSSVERYTVLHKRPELTIEELDKYVGMPTDSPEFIDWVNSKHIKLSDNDSNNKKYMSVLVDGQLKYMCTDIKDFGTLKEPESAPQMPKFGNDQALG